MKYIKWILLFPVSYLSVAITWAFGWLFAIPHTKRLTTDTVKLYDRQLMTFDREYLVNPFSWFGTDDNCADEWFFGCYWRNTWWAGWLTREHYDSRIYGWMIHYLCRVFWIYRNPAYKFGREILGFQLDDYYTQTISFHKSDGHRTWYEKTVWTNPDGKQAFRIKGDFYLTARLYINVNIGWKDHDGFSRLMFAGRVVPRFNKQ